MPLITINKDTCVKDGICSQECPLLCISMDKAEGFPEVRPSREEICILCGHCVAVCPTGSLSHRDVPVEQSPAIRKELTLSPEQAEQFLRSRRSIRAFKDEPVEREKIQKLLEVARYAPTGSNRQLLQFRVFTDRERIDALAAATVEHLRYRIRETP